MKAAFVLYPDFTALDLIGPYEVISRWPDLEVHFLATSLEPVRCDQGLTVIPTDTPATLPDPDLIVVGGSGKPVPVMSDHVLIEWLRTAAPNCKWTASVCTGAGLYAAAGLLEGKTTTTHWGFRDNLRAMGIEVVGDRVVWQGNHVSGAGVSAGIDMALSLTERVHGRQLAESLQLVIEYDPQPPFNSGSPTKADASTLRLAFRLLLGDRPVELATQIYGQAIAARLARASRGGEPGGAADVAAARIQRVTAQRSVTDIRAGGGEDRSLSDSPLSARLRAAVEAQVAAGAPGAVARIEAPGARVVWAGSAGRLTRGASRDLRPEAAFRAASVTKSVTAAVAVRLAGEGRLALDEPLADQLAPELLERWRAFDLLPRATPRQLLAHTSGVPNYFREESFAVRLRDDPSRAWRPVDLVNHAAAHATWRFPPGQGFEYSDTGYVITGILMEQTAGRSLHEIYREYVFDPLGMDSTWLEGHEPARRTDIAHHYSDDLDWTTISPTIDWAGGGLVTTAPDLARFVRGLWSERIIDTQGLDALTRWTPGASFPPESGLRYDRYGLGMGLNVVEGVELLGHTGFVGAFAFHAPEFDAVLVGTHNAFHVDRWPLVAALCRELRSAV